MDAKWWNGEDDRDDWDEDTGECRNCGASEGEPCFWDCRCRACEHNRHDHAVLTDTGLAREE